MVLSLVKVLCQSLGMVPVPVEILASHLIPSHLLRAEDTPHDEWSARTDHLKQLISHPQLLLPFRQPHVRLPHHRSRRCCEEVWPGGSEQLLV